MQLGCQVGGALNGLLRLKPPVTHVILDALRSLHDIETHLAVARRFVEPAFADFDEQEEMRRLREDG